MDADIKEILTRQDRALEKIDGKLDAIRTDISSHLERIAKVEEKSSVAHRRIDDMKELDGSPKRASLGWKEVGAYLVALGVGIGAAIKAFFFGDK